MRTVYVFVVLLGIANAAFAEQLFVVENKMPAFTVVNRVPVVKQSLTTQTVTTYRAPVGHLHICQNGHPFDHQQSASHHCPLCGAEAVRDRNGRYPVAPNQRVVAGTKTVAVDAPAPAVQAPHPVQQATPVFVLPQAAAGCVNGQCSTVTRRFR